MMGLVGANGERRVEEAVENYRERESNENQMRRENVCLYSRLIK